MRSLPRLIERRNIAVARDRRAGVKPQFNNYVKRISIGSWSRDRRKENKIKLVLVVSA